jgi:hypothetical protein
MLLPGDRVTGCCLLEASVSLDCKGLSCRADRAPPALLARLVLLLAAQQQVASVSLDCEGLFDGLIEHCAPALLACLLVPPKLSVRCWIACLRSVVVKTIAIGSL